MIRTSVNIAVDDVRRSSRWYQQLLGCSSPMSADSDHRELFDLLEDSNGDSVVILSRWDHSPLPALRDKPAAPPGRGIVLFFTVPDFEKSWAQAGALDAEVIVEPHPSRGFEIPEFTVLDPDRYMVTVSGGAKA